MVSVASFIPNNVVQEHLENKSQVSLLLDFKSISNLSSWDSIENGGQRFKCKASA